MTIKDQVKEIFYQNRGNFISGEQIAEKLYVSRNAVWKAVKALQNEGYDIKAVTNKGYLLSQNTDIISKSEILDNISNNFIDFKIETFNSLPSTNTYLKSKEMEYEHGTVIIADEQTSGKGRLGRSFFSPNSTGIYMSILLKPKLEAEKAVLITSMTAVAVCNAIIKICNKDPKIKWVNDIFINERKVCGILTEGVINVETGDIGAIILGIGINVFAPSESIPQDISNILGYISEENKADMRNKLIAEILSNISYYYKNFDELLFLQEYKDRSFVIGKTVKVISGKETYDAKAISIDDNCRLIVEKQNGQTEVLSAGEISIKTN